MKKAKRFLTGLLSAALALSLCAMPAMAEEGSGATTTPSTAVWTQSVGSITVHKYEFNGADNEKKPATGERNDAVPNGANPLKDATFTAYQVWDKDALSEYYNGSSDKALPKVDSLIKEENGNYVVKDEAKTPKVAEGTTDANGIATLNKDIRDESSTGLPLGLYLVVETQSPASVTTRCKPFLVSVPMTRIGATKPGEEWLYDVHVYPKNKTTYGDVTLEKYGRVGEDDNTKVPLNGVTFELYKYNKPGDAVTAYTVGSQDWTKVVKSATSSGEGQGADLNLTTEDGKITVNNLTQGYYCFVETDLGANQKYILNQTPHYFKVNADSKSETFTITSTGTLVFDSDKEANLTIEVVDTQPDVDKKVKNRNPKEGEKDWVDASDYSVGDKVPYTITVKVPHELLEAYEDGSTDAVLTVKDTPKNLWVVEGTIEAKPSGENAEAVTDGVDITVDETESPDHGKGFTATFTKSALKALVGTGDTFVITYKAELKDTAVMTVAGNPNTVSLEYSNKIGTDGKIDKGSKKEIHNNAVVYTFKITIEKRGENATGTLLDGVMFDLYKLDNTNGTVKGSDIGFTDENKNNKFVKVKENLTTANGYVSASGLANGDYYLVETKTADKTYNLLSGPVKVTLNVEYTTTWTKTEIYDNDGNLIHRDERETKETFKNAVDEKGEGYTKIVVINRKGFNLPTTGGFGTLLFSGIGVLLVVAGVGVLLSLKKKNRA
jgi:LPXTG-motif cell wall-anchored protein